MGCAFAWKICQSMPTSLLEREASCAYKGHNSPFGIGSRTSYSFGRSVLQKHFEQSSLTLLHKNLQLYQIHRPQMVNQTYRIAKVISTTEIP